MLATDQVVGSRSHVTRERHTLKGGPNSILQYRGSPTSTVSTNTNSTSTIFSAIGIKIRTSGISRIGYVVKFVLVEIGYVVPTSTNFT